MTTAAAPSPTSAPLSKEQQARNDRDRFVAFSFAAADMLAEIEVESGEVLYASGAAQAITGYSLSELTGQCLYERLLSSDRVLLKSALRRIKGGGRIQPLLLRMVQRANLYVPVIVGACHLPHINNNYYVSLSLAQKLLVSYDGDEVRNEESGLLDARSFTEKTKKLLENAEGGATEYRMTLLDLSDFEQSLRRNLSKHTDADDFMLSLGAYLRSTSVDGDSAGLLDDSRYGIVHNHSISEQEIRKYVEDLTRSTNPKGVVVPLKTVNLNLATTGLSGQDATKALVHAVTKFAESGADHFDAASLNDSINDLMQETVSRVKSLKSTISSNAFDVVFQPIVNLNDFSVRHYEALSRFKSDKPTFQIVSFAEEVGMAQEFDLAVAQKVLEYLIYMASVDKRPSVAVNVSAYSVESMLFVAAVRKLFEPYPQLRKKVLFELTESAHITNHDKVNEMLQMLRRDGHQICLDDVGAGATSFHYLRALHVDYIKIDGSYIQSLPNNERDLAFVEAMVTLGQCLNTKIIAEMVETKEQEATLKRLRVECAQGYLYGKPSPLLVEGNAS
jgi:EAL domain-containing protein (putative c-di-GMP-specific phosphodiesterase class I)/PAS domain-containing protein